VNEHFVRHHSNYDLAKYIAYTKDKAPEQTCDEILQWVKNNGWTYEPQGRGRTKGGDEKPDGWQA
jgi:hypothetical protein